MELQRNASKGTLTLTDADITGIHYNGSLGNNIFADSMDLTLVLSGSNRAHGGERAVYCVNSSLIITGGGSLEAEGTNIAILAGRGLTITGGSTITSTSSPNGLSSDSFLTIEDNSTVNITGAGAYGISSKAALTITNSTVEVSTSGFYGISSNGEVEISDSVVSSSTRGCAFLGEGGITVGEGLAIIEPEGGQVNGLSIYANGARANAVVIGKRQIVRVEASPKEGGTVTGAGTYLKRTSATVTAVPDAGYDFVNWTENGEEVSKEAEYTFTVMGDRTLTANFAKLYTITFTDEDGTVLQSSRVPYGQMPSYIGKTRRNRKQTSLHILLPAGIRRSRL